MLQKVKCGYTTTIRKFKSNPSAALAQGHGDAIAISSNNNIQFYVVPAHLYEDMVNFVEFSQRGATELKNIPAKFSGERLNIDKVANDMAKKLLTDAAGEMC